MDSSDRLMNTTLLISRGHEHTANRLVQTLDKYIIPVSPQEVLMSPVKQSDLDSRTIITCYRQWFLNRVDTMPEHILIDFFRTKIWVLAPVEDLLRAPLEASLRKYEIDLRYADVVNNSVCDVLQLCYYQYLLEYLTEHKVDNVQYYNLSQRHLNKMLGVKTSDIYRTDYAQL